MTATQLPVERVAKPWGRRQLAAGFADAGDDEGPIGEIWFRPEGPQSPLMVKYLFTSERLSIQVHPDDAQAQRDGHLRGKDEVWVILSTDAGATIALGPKLPTTRAELAAAAIDGSIEALLDWRPAAAGDVIYSPAGTVHALGAGLVLIEIQQNIDLTYRLYDYGRPRPLHLDAGLAVSNTQPFAARRQFRQVTTDRAVVATGPALSVERWGGGHYHIGLDGPGAVFVPIAGSGRIDGQPVVAGQCWSLLDHVTIELDKGADALFAWPSGVSPIVS